MSEDHGESLVAESSSEIDTTFEEDDSETGPLFDGHGPSQSRGPTHGGQMSKEPGDSGELHAGAFQSAF